MIIYIYNEINHEYIGEMQAQESPLEKGVYLFPPHTTTIKPSFDDGYVSIFD